MARSPRKAPPSREQLLMKLDAAMTAPPKPSAAPPPPLPAPVMRSTYVGADIVQRPPFGSWLQRQVTGKSDAMDMLLKGAKLDPSFPRDGDPDAVREHLGKRGADPDVFEAIDDAERYWLA